MHTNARTLLLLAATLVTIGCGLFDDTFQITGMVRFSDVEGGCWFIRAEDGQSFLPVNLTSEFRRDSLRVQATVEVRQDLVSICQIGQIVDIVRIERR